MKHKKFEELVNEGIKAIPKRFLEKLDNVDIVIEDEPPRGSFLLGLYQGVPQTKRGHYGQVLPDKITIFQKPIERVARSRERQRSVKMNEVHRLEKAVKEIVKNTVWHEIAHHFGMDEKRVREAESRKKKWETLG